MCHDPRPFDRGPVRCLVAPAPELRDRLKDDLEAARATLEPFTASLLQLREPRAMGFNDGLIIPGNQFPPGTPADVVRSVAAERAPLRGAVRVIVVLVDFPDRAMAPGARQHFQDLFFSSGVVPTGSVKEYYREVSNGLIDVAGEVVGPFRLPRTMAEYANGQSGTGPVMPNARTMAQDAAAAADPSVNFRPYDNDGNGYVDAFIVVHAGPGAEVTGNAGDIWSHKWVLPAAFNTDTTRIYAYLTVPEDARLGVCAHELGHLLFGWPDLYDTDYSSEGIGNWCLMAGGSWGNGGDTPVHPSAWCKANQGWVSVVTPTTNGTVTFADVKASHAVHRLWKDGAPGSEYFLVENRQRTQFDAFLPGQGLLVWHVDETISGNADERHYKVALVQADNRKDLEGGRNRGDAGDPYPGSAGNTAFTATSAPNSKSYNGADTCVAITGVAPSGATMTARVSVRCGTTKSPLVEKPSRLEKPPRSEKLFREKPLFDKRPEKPVTDKLAAFDKPPFSEFTSAAGGSGGGGYAGGARDATGELLLRVVASLAERVDVLESQLAQGGGTTGGADAGVQPFIDQSQRPDLTGGALSQEDDLEELRRQMQENGAAAKRLYDTKAPER